MDHTYASTTTLPDASGLIIVGIYGGSGAGGSYEMKKIEKCLGHEVFHYFEGADEIASLVQGDLQHFQHLEQAAKERVREQAICRVRDTCAAEGKAGVVAGHFMLWSDDTKSPLTVWTKKDRETITHIIYLATDAEMIAQRRRKEPFKRRGELSTYELRMWQEAEMAHLRNACYRNNILFTALSAENTNDDYVAALLSNFHSYGENNNLLRAQARLHQIMTLRAFPAKTMLVFDADRTLSATDTGESIWQHKSENPGVKSSPLRAVFTGPLDYSHGAFRQAALLYHERYSKDMLDTVCQEIASRVDLYPEMASMLRQALIEEHSGVLVVTCGLQLVWEKILSRHGFSTASVIGAGRLDDIVVDATIKAALVKLLRESYGVRVTAFGDSPLDLQMLGCADRAVIVVGNEVNRSKRMDLELGLAIKDGMLKAEQAVVVPKAPPRLNTQMLPTVSLADPKFLDDVFHGRSKHNELRVFHTTNRGAAKLLMTSMRDASIRGPALRNAHHRAGWYLATEILPDVLGMEEYSIAHVQGHSTSGHRVKDECRTLIVALMRGGEPMALGVNEALASAVFLHAKHAHDVTAAYLEGTSAVILVDSVVNSGNTMIEFVGQVHELKRTVAIVMLVGVVQSESIMRLKMLHQRLEHPRVALVALRISENKYKGQGGTDTGNRLYNTIKLG